MIKLNPVSRKKPKPPMSWQSNDYSRSAEMKFTIPYQFLLLCRLVGVPPRQMLIDFMDNLSMGNWKREGREQAREKIKEYFLEQGYGKEYYSAAELKTILRELEAVGLVYPYNASESFLNEHTRWRENFHTWWFKKWFEKNNRNP